MTFRLPISELIFGTLILSDAGGDDDDGGGDDEGYNLGKFLCCFSIVPERGRGLGKHWKRLGGALASIQIVPFFSCDNWLSMACLCVCA